MRVDGDGGVDGRKPPGGGNRLGRCIARVGFIVENLALEIGPFDDVAIDQDQVPDPGAG
jgi:hypothetical protein